MDKSLLCMTILWLLLVIYIKQSYLNEHFTINQNNLPNHIWMYWENKPGKTKPNYLKLCFKTIFKHNHNDFQIHLLDLIFQMNYL